MTSLLDLDNYSDSEGDCDYEPLADVISSGNEEPLPTSNDEKETKRKSRNGQKSSLEPEYKPTEDSRLVSKGDYEKKKAEDVYKSFLDEVAADMRDAKNEPMSSGISCSGSTTSSPVVLNNDKKSSQSSTVNTPEKLAEFSGESISINDNTVTSSTSDSSCISNSQTEINTSVPTAPSVVKRKGLESVLGDILSNKKQKMTTLTKSMLDWKNFKKEEGIEEDVASYNRGKGGFLERKRFLERSDVRSFEIERDMRLEKKHTQRKKDI